MSREATQLAHQLSLEAKGSKDILEMPKDNLEMPKALVHFLQVS